MDGFVERSGVRMNARILVAAACVLLAVGCAKRMIPGTQIPDTDDTQAILSLMNKYRVSVEGRDATSITALVSDDFEDTGGTPTLDDDLDRQNLEQALKDRFARIDKVKLDFDVRSIAVDDEQAEAVYYYTLRYETPGLSDKVQSASDLKKMTFRQVDDQWKIVSGI